MMSEERRMVVLEKYTKEMEVIKYRVNQVFTIVGKIPYLEPTVEYMALQTRKIIEQILLASLVANADEYMNYYNRLGNEWNARLIARDIMRINPDFFPKAVINRPEVMIIDNRPDSMTCDELIKIYERMGRLLHSTNPFSAPLDYAAESEYIQSSCQKIVELLSTHTIHLIGGNDFLYVVMNASNKKGNVAINWFTKCDEEETRRFNSSHEIPLQDSAISNGGC